MASNQIKVSLMFSADTDKAQSSLKNLQTSLNDLTKSMKIGDFKITDQVKEAYEATEKLKQALNASVNMSTGQFDLTKFQGQLKNAGISAQDLSKKMASVGPAGVKAFNDLAIAVANAEIPTKRVNVWLDKMAKSLKDTMRWQFSSSIVHGLQGTLQQAYGYAQDLNKSLNDIRIVTSYSSEDMANFAEQANKAAKALSTSTNEYAKASLIFYQQGLNDQEVAKRTAATIKMANVTGESAQNISSYMTAIWNNFEDGTKTLEYYADAITALGAATASSSEEIATGMQQFAAIGKTVGLSYEYAASALATVVAETRQSEKTVGTSFKTIFSRLQSLSLGETLEDDTTLTKYSAALAKVGIDIKINNDELKSMDKILDELGQKWATLNSDQKNALAYTVAGSRQYTNFIALLDNYDTFKINVDIATESEGTLEEQQKIYAESWEAAADRVRAAAEGIFQDLIDDDFFINLLDGFEKLLSMLDKFIDAIGGLPGVLSIVSSLMLRIFSTQAKQGLENLGYNLKSFLGINQQQSTKTKEEFLKASKKSAEDMMSRVDVKSDPALQAELDSLAKRSELEREYIRLEDTLTEQQKEKYRTEMQILDVLQQQKKIKHQEMSEAEDETRGAIGAVIREATQAAQKKSFEEQQLNIQEQLQASISGYESDQAQREIRIKNQKSQRATQEEIIRVRKDQLGQLDKDILAQAKYNVEARDAGTLTVGDMLKLEKLQDDRDSVKQHIQEARAIIERIDWDILKAEEEQKQTTQMLKEAQAVLSAMNDTVWDSSNFDVSQSAFVGEAFQGYIDKETASVTREFELQNLLKASANLPDAQANPEAHRKALEQLQASLTEFNKEYSEELGEETQRVIEAIIADVQSDFSTEEGGVSITADSIQKYSEQIKQAAKTDSSTELKEIRESLSAQGIDFSEEQFTTIQTALDGYIKKVRQAAEVTQKETEAMSESLDNLGEKGKEPVPYKFADSFINLSEGITSAATALASFRGIWSTLTNPDLSGWEKFTTVLMSIGTVVGSVMSAISALQKVQYKQMGITIKDTAAKIANALANKINTHFTNQNTKAKRGNAEAISDNIEETNKETGAKIVEGATERLTGGTDKVGFGTKIKGGFTNFGKGFMTTTKGIAGKGSANAIAAGSGGSVASALGSIAAVAVPIAIAAAAIAGTIAIIVNVYQAAEKAAKKAEKQAESLRSAAEEVKQEYQETVNTISNYQNSLEGLKKLTKGTQEWRDAIAESNDQARKLIDKFGNDLQAGDYYFEDGQIKFKEGVLESLQEKKYNDMMQAQAGADSASVIALQKRNEADKIEFARKNMRTGQSSGAETGGTMAASIGGGALAGAALGTFIPIIGNLIGAGIGAAVGLIGGAIGTSIAGAASEAEQEAIDKLTELYRKDSTIIDQMAQAQKSGKLNDFAKQYGISEELANSLLKNKDATKELIIQMAANVNEMQLLRESIVANANRGKTAYDIAENQEYINARVAKLMRDPNSKEYQAAQAKIDELFKGVNDDFWDLYLSKVVGDNENYRVINQGGKGATLQKKDENGNWVTDETLGKNGLMEADAIEALRNVLIADLAPDIIESFDIEGQKLTKSLQNAGVSDKEIAKRAVKAKESGEAIDLSSLTRSQLDSLNIEAIVDTELANAIAEAQINARTSWENMLADFSQSTKNAIEQLDSANFGVAEQFTRNQLEIYGTALEQLTRIGGDGVAQAFNNNLTQLLNINKDAAYEIMAVIAGIDWSNTEEGLWAFQNGLSDIGISVDVMSWNIDELGTKFGDIDFSPAFMTNLDSVSNKLAFIAGTLSKMDYGTIISEEEYKNVPELFQNLFIEDITSTDKEKKYRFLGGDQDWTTIVQEGAKKEINDSLEKNENAKVAELLKDYNFDDISNWPFEKLQNFYQTIQNSEDLRNILGWSYNDTLLPEDLGVMFTPGYTDIYNKKAIEAAQNYIAATGGTAALDDQTFSMMKFYGDHYNKETGQWDTLENAQEYYRYQALRDISDKFGYLESRVDLQGLKESYKNNFDEAAGWKVSYDWQDYLPTKNVANILSEFYKNWSGKEVSPEELESYMKRYASTLTSTGELNKAKRQGLISNSAYDKALYGLENKLETLKEQIDIYEDEEAQIKSINRQLEEQQEITEKLHGKEKLQSLQKELILNKHLLSVNKKGLEVAKQDLENEKTNFKEKAKEKWGEDFTNLIRFDKSGNIINWEELRRYLYETEGEIDVNIFDTYRDSIIEAEGRVENFTNSVKENEEIINSYWGTSAETIAENYDFISGKQEELKAQVESYRNTIDLIGKKTLGIDNETLKEINESMMQISTMELQGSYDNYIKQQQNREKAERAYLKNRNTTTKEALETAQAEEAKALAEMNNKWAAALEQASQTLQDNISLIMESFEEALSGIGQSFERMSEIYDQKSQISDQYLADYKKVYELNKLSRDIQNSIDDSNNIKSKQMLNELQVELNALQKDNTKMSEYDLNYLQKKYDLRLAEIALEESQNAKNQVRLQRTANGSWGYVYTQNEETIDKAQQEYEDKLFNLQDLNNNYLDTISQQILSTQSEFKSAIMEIYSLGLSPEEQKKRIDITVAYYQNRLGFLTTEFDKVIENNQGLQNMVQSFSDTLLGSLYPDEYDDAKDIYSIFTEKLNGENGLLEQLQQASQKYSETIDSIFNKLDTSMTDFTENLQTEINKLIIAIEGLQDLGRGFNRKESIEILEEIGYKANWDEQDNKFIKQMWNLAVSSGMLDSTYGMFTKFDTGGYTGEWGPEGKFAMLHEKEIVLNATDTQNLLHIMEIMDQIIKNIDLSASAAASSSLRTPSISSVGDTLQQQVTIHAEFPYATNHHEIEAAFDSLINRAAQYANRNR